MAARVQVVVEAKDATAGVFRAITSQLGDFGGIVEELTAKNVSWGNVATQAAQMVINGVKDAINVTQEYAADVRDLALASGQTAEASSRMLQVLDDYQLTADDAATATRALTKQGLAPTIETVAKLSGEYLQLNDAQARNEFLMKNLGRAGKEWMNLLAQGPDAIMAMNDAVSEGLILTEENIKASEEYRLALDQFNDGVMALKVSIGNELLPTLTTMMNGLNNSNEIRAEANRLMMEGIAHNREEAMTMAAATVAAQEQTVAKTDLAEATQTAAQREAELAEAAKITSDENKNFIGVLGNVSSALNTYRDGIKEADQALADGKISAEEHAAKVSALASAYEETKNRVVLSIVEMKLAQDGWTDAELNAYLKVGQQLGVFTQGMVTETKRVINAADEMTKGLDKATDPILHVGKRAADAGVDLGIMADGAVALEDAIKPATAAVSGLKSQLNGLPVTGTAWQYDFIINTSGQVPRFATASYSTAAGYNTNVHPGDDSGRQQGGEVFAGVPTWVGEAGRERFVPAMNGRILGHAESLHAATVGGGGGTNYFYGPVTLQLSEEGASGIMGIR